MDRETDDRQDIDNAREANRVASERANQAISEMARLAEAGEVSREADDNRRAADDERRGADDQRRVADDDRRAADDVRRGNPPPSSPSNP